MSGLDDEELAIESVRAGAQDYVVKGTMSTQVLVRAVRYAVERKHLQRELAAYAAQLRTRNARPHPKAPSFMCIRDYSPPLSWVVTFLRFSKCRIQKLEFLFAM